MDQLTGLPNRRSLFEMFKEAEMSTDMHCRAVAMVDVDKFKTFNDTYGHQAGDKCLAAIGSCFAEAGERYAVTFYRYGGEEFIGIFDDDSDTDPFLVCRELNENVRELGVENSSATSGYVTVSIGLTFVEEGASPEFETWIYQADSAVYTAKKSGRDMTVVYEGDELPGQMQMSFRTR
jgi:diguanylate cyclase (GGDEF)-like protein